MVMAMMLLTFPSLFSTITAELFTPMVAKSMESAGKLPKAPAAVDPGVEAQKAVEAANAKVVAEQALKKPEAPVAAAKIPDALVEVGKQPDVKIMHEPAKGSSADPGALAYVLIALSLLGFVGFGMAKHASRKKSSGGVI